MSEIPGHFPFVSLDEFVIMPNHVHGILIINHSDNATGLDNESVETLHATSLRRRRQQQSSYRKNETMAYISQKPGSLPTIIRSFKSAVTKSSRLINPDFAWQTRFHDHIIRNEKSLNSIRQYIMQNQLNWQKDTNNPDWKDSLLFCKGPKQ